MDYSVKRFEITAQDGLVLRGEVFGEQHGEATPVLCLPGLTRNSRDFHPLAERLASDPLHPRFVMILNSRGRGPSDYDSQPENYNVMIEAQDAMDALTAAGIDEAVFLGTSRGGLLTLAIAAIRPNIIAGAIFNDIGPVIDATGLARIKTYLTRSKPVEDWDDAVDYLKTANSGQFTDLSEAEWNTFAHMTFREEESRPKRDFDTAIADGLKTIDISQPLPSAWPQFEALSHCPVLVVRGEHSDILPRSVAEEMVARHPDCEWIDVPQQGHAPLFIRDDLNDQIAEFLSKLDAKRLIATPQAEPAWLEEEEINYLDAPEDSLENIPEPSP